MIRVKGTWIIFRKELLDILRDRRTLGFMVALPVMVIPAIMWIAGKFVESGVRKLREEASIIAVIGGDEAPSLVRLLERLDSASDSPAFLAELGDPLLARGLTNMLTREEGMDAMLAAGSVDEDQLEGARFIEVEAFAPVTADGRALFAGGRPEFVRDPVRLRLLSSALRLAEREEDDDEEATLPDPALLADRQRLANLSPDERALFDQQLTRFRALQREVVGGIEERDYHAVLVLHDGFAEALGSDDTARYTVLFDGAQEKSEVAERKLSGFLDRLGAGIVRARIVGHRLDRTLLDPFAQTKVNVGRERNILAIMLPYIVLLMCFLGAIYPAIDLAAGEKERGTLETLLVTPAPRHELVVGKFLVVTLTALVAAMLNILSLYVSMRLGLFSAGGDLGIRFDPWAAVLSAVLMLPVAALFAAVLLATSIFAKSFKEAQSYTAPINMAVIVPALFSFIPGVELTIPLSTVPLVNVSLALKEAWGGIYQWDCIAVIFVSSGIYALVALLFCTRWFQREDVLFRT